MIKNLRPTTLIGIRSYAVDIKKAQGIPHHKALDAAAVAAGYSNYSHAQKQLMDGPEKPIQLHVVYFTAYWVDIKARSRGRETYQLTIPKPLKTYLSKATTKQFGALRVAATDHLVSDGIHASQSSAIREICQTVRRLILISRTGLRPYWSNKEKWQADLHVAGTLPDRDHRSYWRYPGSEHFIMIDEPYELGPTQMVARAEWAQSNNWTVRLSKWPGMYKPNDCSFFVATPDNPDFDLEALLSKIDGLPELPSEWNWTGTSVKGNEIFVSPGAPTRKGALLARPMEIVPRKPSSKTIPIYGPLSNERKPIQKMSVEAHRRAGQIFQMIDLTDLLSNRYYSRLISIRSQLEDWMAQDCSREFVEGPEFLDIYYGRGLKEPPRLSPEEFIQLVEELKAILTAGYNECDPLTKILRTLDSAIHQVRSGLEKASA